MRKVPNGVAPSVTLWCAGAFPPMFTAFLRQRDTARNNRLAQPLDNYLTVDRGEVGHRGKVFSLRFPQGNDPPALFGRRGARMESSSCTATDTALPVATSSPQGLSCAHNARSTVDTEASR